MALLPEDPRDQYRFLGVILLVAVGALFYLYVYRPRAAELDEMEQRVEQVEQQNELAESRMGSTEETRREVALSERQFAALERLVPSRSEVPQIYEEIASESQSLGLELVNVTPAEALPDTSGHFLRQTWEMQVEGEYHDVGRFLTRIASLERIVRPEVQTVSPTARTESGRQLVSVTFDLQTYVLPPPGSRGAGSGGEEDGDDD